MKKQTEKPLRILALCVAMSATAAQGRAHEFNLLSPPGVKSTNWLAAQPSTGISSVYVKTYEQTLALRSTRHTQFD